MEDKNELQNQASSSPVQEPSPSGQDAEERIKGFQKALNAKHAELVRKEQEWLSQKSLLEKELESYKARFADLTSQLSERERIARENEQRAATLASQVERIRKVAEYGLMDHEAKGLLRQDLSGEELDRYLKEFSALLGEQQKRVTEELLRGATPVASAPRDVPTTPQDVLRAMAEALQRGDVETYESLADRLYRQARKE